MELTQTAREETAEEMQDVEDLTQRGPEDQGLEEQQVEQQAEQQLPANAAGARVQRRVRGAPAAAPAPPCPGKARDSPSPAPGTSGRSRYRRTVVVSHAAAGLRAAWSAPSTPYHCVGAFGDSLLFENLAA